MGAVRLPKILVVTIDGFLSAQKGVPGGTRARSTGKHVMVSYQWDVQEAVLRIVGSLKQRSFAVWFDMDEMSGSTLDAMVSISTRILG